MPVKMPDHGTKGLRVQASVPELGFLPQPTTMLPFYIEEQKRRINLGGNSQSASASDLLDSVKAQREARLELKRKQDAALKIQAWWRGRSEAERAKDEMRATFLSDVMGIQGLRCLVLMGLDERALGLWSQTVASASKGA